MEDDKPAYLVLLSPIIKTPGVSSDETPVVRELPLIIFRESVTAGILFLLSLGGQLDTVLSRRNK